MKQFTIMKARELNESTVRAMIGDHSRKLEELGMSREDACIFVSNVMNFGITMQERLEEGKKAEKNN